MKRTFLTLSLLLYSLSVQAQTWTLTADAENFKGVCSGINTTKRIEFRLANTAKSLVTAIDNPPSTFTLPVPNLAQDNSTVRDSLEHNFAVAITNVVGTVTILNPSSLTRKVFRWQNDVLMTPFMEKNPYAKGWISDNASADNCRSFPGVILDLVLKNTYTVPQVTTYRGLQYEFSAEPINPVCNKYGLYAGVNINYITASRAAPQRMFSLTPDGQRIPGLESIGFAGPDGGPAQNAVLINDNRLSYNADGTIYFIVPRSTWAAGSGSYDIWGLETYDGVHLFNSGNFGGMTTTLRVTNSPLSSTPISINKNGDWISDGTTLIVNNPAPVIISGVPKGPSAFIKSYNLALGSVQWVLTGITGQGLITDGVVILQVSPADRTATYPLCLLAVDAITGVKQWMRDTTLGFPVAAGFGLVYLARYGGKTTTSSVTCLDVHTGRVLWTSAGYDDVAGVALLSGTVVASNANGYAVLDAFTGRVLNTLATQRGAENVFMANRMFSVLFPTYKTFESVQAKYQAGLPVTLSLPAVQSGSRLSCYATGTDVRYQWSKDGVSVDGATDRWLTVTEAGNYSCKAFNADTSQTTLPVAVALSNPLTPYLSLQGTTTYNVGDSITFRAFAQGDNVLYLWTVNGIPQSSVVDSMLLLGSAEYDKAVVTCTARDGAGNSVSLGSTTLATNPVPIPYPIPDRIAPRYNPDGSIIITNLTARVTNSLGSEIYTWQFRNSPTAAWQNVPKVTGSAWSGIGQYMTYLVIKAYTIGQQYRFLVVNAAGSAVSNTCTTVTSLTTTTTTTPTGSK